MFDSVFVRGQGKERFLRFFKEKVQDYRNGKNQMTEYANYLWYLNLTSAIRFGIFPLESAFRQYQITLQQTINVEQLRY